MAINSSQVQSSVQGDGSGEGEVVSSEELEESAADGSLSPSSTYETRGVKEEVEAAQRGRRRGDDGDQLTDEGSRAASQMSSSIASRSFNCRGRGAAAIDSWQRLVDLRSSQRAAQKNEVRKKCCRVSPPQ